MSKALAMKVFVRDGFLDRYSGQGVVFPAALRALSIFAERFSVPPQLEVGCVSFRLLRVLCGD